MKAGRIATTCVLVASLAAVPRRAAAQPAPSSAPRAWDQDSPAKAADPPLLPPPPPRPPGEPLSTSGTDVATSEPPTPAAPGVDAAEAARREARIKALEERVAADERRLRRLDERTKIWRYLKLGAYVQPQLLVQSYDAAASPNQQANGSLPPGISANDTIAKPDGSTTNGTAFRLRRTRFMTTFEHDVARVFVMIDAFPLGGIGPGIGTIVRNAEATGIARWSKSVRTEFTAGVFITPFRAELLEMSNVRPFIERTWFVQNVFPGERDLGVHAKTLALEDRLVFDLAVINGQRLGEPHFVQTPDLNKSKDLAAALTYRMGPLLLGVNGYLGRGQVVDASNLRFKELSRWAVNYQALYRQKLLKRLGETRVSAELTIAQNMDTGINYAFAVPRIPTDIHDDVVSLDERALYVRVEQDLSPWLLAGYRYDFYTPDTQIANDARDTHAFLAVVRFSPNLRWMNELDWAIDNVHAAPAAPPSKHIVSFSTVLQAGF